MANTCYIDMQVSNPVPRIAHPPWLHKKLLEKNDVFKQKRISEMFMPVAKPQPERQESLDLFDDSPPQDSMDIEDIGGSSRQKGQPNLPMSTKRKRNQSHSDSSGLTQKDTQDSELSQSWRDVLGPSPSMGKTKVGYQYKSRLVFSLFSDYK